MNIGIIGALDEELKPIREFSGHLQKVQKRNRTYWAGDLNGNSLHITRCDPGKVNASVAAQQLIEHFEVDAIFNMGASGALAPELEVGDLVVATECIQHDFDVTAWGMKPGEILFDVRTAPDGMLNFRSQQIFQTDAKLSDRAFEIARKAELTNVGGRTPKIYKGRILSGDQFISQTEKAGGLWKTHQALCVDMEAAAIAHVCALNDVPFLCIRAMSDKADHSAHISFGEFLGATTVNYGKIIEALLKEPA